MKKLRTWHEFFTFIKEMGFNPVSVIDVGVATDTEEMYYHFQQARYLFVEPLAEFESHLQQWCKVFPGSQYMLAAAGEVNGELDLYVGSDIGGCSKYLGIEALETHIEGEIKIRTVPQYTLNEMWNALDFKGPALLKIDVQGAELNVINGATDILDNIEVIIMECSFIEQYKGQPLFHEYIARMAELNYVVFDMMDPNFARSSNILHQIDLIFVKKDGMFRQDQRCMSAEDYVAYVKSGPSYKGVTRNNDL